MSAARCIGLPVALGVFTAEENNVLTKLVLDEHSAITRNKRNGSNSVKRKKCGWTTITEEFNLQPGVKKRSTKEIKKWWENMKMIAKNQPRNKKCDVISIETLQIKDSNEHVEDAKPIIVSNVRSLYPDYQSDRDSVASDAPTSYEVTVKSSSSPDSHINEFCDFTQNHNSIEDKMPGVSQIEDKLSSYAEEERHLRVDLIRNRINQENELHKLKMQQLQEQHEMNMKIQLEKHELYIKRHNELLQLELKQKSSLKLTY